MLEVRIDILPISIVIPNAYVSNFLFGVISTFELSCARKIAIFLQIWINISNPEEIVTYYYVH